MLRELIKAKKKEAQTIVEYTVVLGVVVAAIIAMTPMVRRANQTFIKLMADQIGNQLNSEQKFNANRGYLVESYTTTTQQQNHGFNEALGVIKYTHQGSVTVATNSLTNSGFLEN